LGEEGSIKDGRELDAVCHLTDLFGCSTSDGYSAAPFRTKRESKGSANLKKQREGRGREFEIENPLLSKTL
jgi:hypothetical protein